MFGTKNPFTFGTIVTSDEFIDRAEEQAQILKTIRMGESAIIRSPNGMGKSSLLAEIARKNSKEFIFVSVDLTGIADETGLLHAITRETMHAAFGSVETFPPEAWELLMNSSLRQAVIEGVRVGFGRRYGPRFASVPAKQNAREGRDLKKTDSRIDIRMCPQCGKPLKWVDKYSRHYCYTCKKYAPIRRTVKLPISASGVLPVDELICPKCRGPLNFVHRYSEYYCQKCRKYPMIESKRRVLERPTMADMVEALDLPERIANQNATRVIVMFDEFQEIATIENPLILETMRQRFDMHGNVSYVFAGSNAQILSQMFNEKEAPFHNFAHWMELGPILNGHLERFLTTKFDEAKGKLPRDAANTIIGVSGGYPYYAQKIAHELYHISASPTLKQVEDAVGSVLRHQSPLYLVLWESIRSPLHRKYLLAAANEPRVTHGEDFVRRHGLKSRSHIQRIEKQLEVKGIISGGEIIDPMFVLWLRSTANA